MAGLFCGNNMKLMIKCDKFVVTNYEVLEVLVNGTKIGRFHPEFREQEFQFQTDGSAEQNEIEIRVLCFDAEAQPLKKPNVFKRILGVIVYLAIASQEESEQKAEVCPFDYFCECTVCAPKRDDFIRVKLANLSHDGKPSAEIKASCDYTFKEQCSPSLDGMNELLSERKKRIWLSAVASTVMFFLLGLVFLQYGGLWAALMVSLGAILDMIAVVSWRKMKRQLLELYETAKKNG